MSKSRTSRLVAVIAAHADDEVLGCGGTIARWASEGDEVHVLLMADGESSRPDAAARDRALIDARNGAADAAAAVLGCASVTTLGLPDNRMDRLELLDVVQAVEKFLARISPSVVLTHHAGDVNIDHRVVQDAVVAACRPQPGHFVRDLLFFEVASSTEWRPAASAMPFTPDWFVDISAHMDRKRAALKCYEREMRPFPHARSIEAVDALAAWRGATIGVAAAEGFMLGRRIER